MILNLIDLRNEFENLKKIRIDIKKYFEHLSDKIQLLTNIYGKYIKEENRGTILFGLDALHFQTFLIHFEYDNMKNMHILIENKLYCEYYKLLKLIINYVKLNIDDYDILKICDHKTKYPVYKDLEQYKVYDFELIDQIHHDILILLELMSKFVIKKEKELELDETNTSNGLNLHIVVNTIDFNISLLKQNLKLYINYLKIFHKYHTTYLSRLNIKIGIMNGQVNKDIKLERTISPTTVNERKSKINISPSLSNIQQEEIISFIDNDNPSVKDEINEIIIHISDESENNSDTDNDTDTDIDIKLNDNLNSTNLNDLELIQREKIENKIDINKLTNEDNNENMDIGDLSSIKLKEQWLLSINQSQMIHEDIRYVFNDTINNENNDTNNNENNDINKEEINNFIENDIDELNKWREIINNNNLTSEEKIKEKTKLKKLRYKNNKKFK
jgi:hypothetical protein